MKAQTNLEILSKMYKTLKKFGGFRWHTSNHGSIYIKFRDTRLGSLRIADHTSLRKNYNYKYNIDSTTATSKDVEYILEQIAEQITKLRNFDPKKYVVFHPGIHGYIILKNFEEYRQVIKFKEYPDEYKLL